MNDSENCNDHQTLNFLNSSPFQKGKVNVTMNTTATYKTMYTATDLLIESLLEEKVEVVFSSPSQALSSIHSSIQKYESLKSVFMNHEQAIVHAADGYAEKRGRLALHSFPQGLELRMPLRE
jgi:hypothetical protein